LVEATLLADGRAARPPPDNRFHQSQLANFAREATAAAAMVLPLL
jgi:hypothetical protein